MRIADTRQRDRQCAAARAETACRTVVGARSVSAGTSAGNSCVITNIATLAPMSAFSAVEMGPGPNEIDDVLADG